jgi:UDP-glucose 4-epimerase
LFCYHFKMILIVGGAGYIGSQVNKLLSSRGFETVIFDNLVKGHKELVKWGHLEIGDLNDKERIREVFRKYKIEAVLNFAAFIEVGESVKDPEAFYYNNVVNTLNLLSVMKEFEVEKIIFSSTAATFGIPEYVPIDEKHSQKPINPYGKTKLVIENIFKDYDTAYGLKYVVFRYFNACGADKDAEIGEWHIPESHLIPILLEVAAGKRDHAQINGQDYPTPDGTCIRDYIHVEDLAEAHLLGLKHLLNGRKSRFFNLGSGSGYSNKEVLETVKKVTGSDFRVEYGPRREGDAPSLVASSGLIKKELGWEAKYKNLEEIIRTAWEWYKKREGK